MDNGVIKRIHLLLTIFAGVVTAVNIFLTFFRGEGAIGLIDLPVLVPLIILLILFVIYFLLNSENTRFLFFVRYLHVGILLITAVISILDYYGNVYGIGFSFLGGYLALQYKLVNRRRTLAITVYFIIIIILVEFSALVTAEEDKRGVALDVIAFLAFFYLVIITLDSFRVKKILDKNKELTTQRDDFRHKYRIAADLDNYIDLPKILSPRQFEIAGLIYSRGVSIRKCFDTRF